MDNDPIPLSALQHWAYCPRQCALIHLEQAFEENVHTLRGQAVHNRADQPGVTLRADLRVERALPLFNDRLGLVGKADVVEFLEDGTPYPVEYKHGSRNKKAAIAACDDLQLAGQALCLEEMSGKPVPEGALFTPAPNVAGSCRSRPNCVMPWRRLRVRSAQCSPPAPRRHR
jgi:CRISPR-associated exonuclease Cas4